MTKKSGVAPDSRSIPHGGGAVTSIGDAFRPNLSMGGGIYKIPLDLPSGPGGFAPKVDLVYHTGQGTGVFGFGWNITVPFIELRKPVPGDTEPATSKYRFMGQEDLIEVAAGQYMAAAHNEYQTYALDNDVWSSQDLNLTRATYGGDDASRLKLSEDDGPATVRWFLSELNFSGGGRVLYHYETHESQLYLRAITWSVYRLDFIYEDRPDPFVTLYRNQPITTLRRCREITLSSSVLEPHPVYRKWRLEYQQAAYAGHSLLNKVTLSGHRYRNGVEEVTAPPALEFGYTDFSPDALEIKKFTHSIIPPPLLDADVTAFDFKGTGLPGILQMNGRSNKYWPNRGNFRWGPPEQLRGIPQRLRVSDREVLFADITGSATIDLVVADHPQPGYYPHHPERGFEPKRTLSLTPSFSMKEDGSKLVDLNRDGVLDLLTIRNNTCMGFFNNRGESWSAPHVYVTDNLPFINPADPRVRFADMTGSGQPDLVMVYSGCVVYYPFDPVSGWGLPREMANAPYIDVRSDCERVFLSDTSGDGLADMIAVGTDTVTLWLNQGGMGFSEPYTIRRTPPVSGNRVLIGDFSGSGTAGLMWCGTGISGADHQYYYLDFWAGIKPYLMNCISNNRGLESRITYESSVAQRVRDWYGGPDWQSFLPFPVQVVTEVVNEDTVAGTRQITRYRYHEGNYDWRARRYLGFGRVESMELGDATEDGTYKVLYFHNQADSDDILREAARGEPYKIETASLADPSIIFEVEDVAYDALVFPGIDGEHQAMITLEKSRKVSRLQDGSVFQSDKTEKTYDAYGRLVSDTRTGEWTDKDDVAHVDILISEREYAAGPEVANLPCIRSKRNGDGKLLRLERIYYDGPAFQGLPLGNFSKGLQTRVEEAVLNTPLAIEAYDGTEPDLLATLFSTDTDPAYGTIYFRQKERLKRDPDGVVIETLKPPGARTEVAYDAAKVYPVRVTLDGRHVQEVRYDPISEQIEYEKCINGNVTRIEYDGLGNILALSRPGAVDGKPTETYAYHTDQVPNVTIKKVRLNPDDPQATWLQYEYKDGHQREFQKRTSAENGQWAVGSQIRFNSKGREVVEYEAYFVASPDFDPVVPAGVAASGKTYDALGRLIKQVHFNDAVSQVRHAGPFTSYYSPLIQGAFAADPDTPPTRMARRDAWNRAVEITENGANESVTVLHRYDPFDQVLEIINPAGTQSFAYVYDLTGRPIRITSVDAGTEKIIRDANLEEALVIDGAGRAVFRENDAWGRVVAIRKDGPTGDVHSEFEYDGSQTDNSIGRLTRVTAVWGSAEYTYNPDGKTTQVTRRFADHPEVYTVGYEYNSQSKPVKVLYPDGTRLDYQYNSAALLDSISGVIDDVEYNATGKRIRVRYENGVESTINYIPGEYQIRELKTVHQPSGDVYQHLVYHFDDVGQVTAIKDNATIAGKVRNNQAFEYDLRHQLIRATGKGAGGPYDYRYQYDIVGNMIRNDEAGGEDVLYGLQTGDLARPHRMVRRTTGAGSEFDYDAAGNLIKTPDIQSMTYCSRHRPTEIVKTDGTRVEYVYDHDGQVIVTKVATGNQTSIEYNIENLFYVEEQKTTKVVFDLNKKVAVLPSDGDGTLFHIDRNGNNNIFSNLATGAFIGQNEYTPYGRLSVAIVLMPNLGFQQSQFHADTQMVQLGSRFYLPYYGRFLVADAYLLHAPEKMKMFLISYNLYTYSNNNPINFVDPSGNFIFLLSGILTCLAYVIIAAVVVGAVAGIVAAATNGAQTWDEWLLSIIAGIVGAILVTLVGFAIGGLPGALIALSIFMFASWFGTPIAHALDESDSPVAWFFSFLIKWIQSPVLTTLGLLVVIGYAIAGHDIDLERGTLFVNVGGNGGGALTLGAIVWARGGNFDANGDVDDDLARHEAYHTRQVVGFGEMGFYVTYLILGTIWGEAEAGTPFATDHRGCGNPFEKTARTNNHAAPATPADRC